MNQAMLDEQGEQHPFFQLQTLTDILSSISAGFSYTLQEPT
jgi:hypothetical protein